MIGVGNCLRYNHHCGCVTQESEEGYRIEKQCYNKHELPHLCMDYPKLEYIVIQTEID